MKIATRRAMRHASGVAWRCEWPAAASREGTEWHLDYHDVRDVLRLGDPFFGTQNM